MNFSDTVAHGNLTHASTSRLDSGDIETTVHRSRFFSIHAMERIWRVALNERWWIVGILAACVILGAIATLIATPRYTAKSRIEISRQESNITNVRGVDDVDRSRDMEFYDTQYALLGARSLAERVSRTLNLSADDEFFATFEQDPDDVGLIGDVRPDAGMEGFRRSRRQRMATEILLDYVDISPIRGSSLVDISFTSPDPQLSARIANTWVNQFVEANLARRYDSTAEAREFLEKRLNDLRIRLEASERQLVNYASANDIVKIAGDFDEDSDKTLVSSDLAVVNEQLANARAERIAAESAYQASRGAKEALENPAINGIRERRAEVASERAKLLSTFEPDYPQVAALTSQLRDLDASIAAEEQRVQRTVGATYREALSRERDLEARLQTLKGSLSNQNRQAIQYNIYKREVDTNRELYDGLLQRYKEIGVAGVGANNTAVVDPAEVPERPSSPNLLFNMLLSVIAGCTLAGLFLFVRDQLDQSLRDPSDVKRLLNLPQLGVVPDVRREDLDDALIDRKSTISEAYFSIGTNLAFLTNHGVPRSILFTSSRPNEGKSTSAFAISNMLARIGKKTLLVDADLRNPSAHLFVDLPNERGLSNFLSGEQDTQALIMPSGHENFSIMASGPIPPNAAELLTGSRLGELMTRLLKEYDHIVVDGPPVLGLADAPILSSNVEGVIVAIEANGAKIRAIQMALERLNSSGAHIFGAIVTKVNNRNSAYGYGDSYGYGYKYAGAEQEVAN